MKALREWTAGDPRSDFVHVADRRFPQVYRWIDGTLDYEIVLNNKKGAMDYSRGAALNLAMPPYNMLRPARQKVSPLRRLSRNVD